MKTKERKMFNQNGFPNQQIYKVIQKGPFKCVNEATLDSVENMYHIRGAEPKIFFEDTQRDLLKEWFPDKTVAAYSLNAINDLFKLHVVIGNSVKKYIINNSGQLLVEILECISETEGLCFAIDFEKQKIGVLNWQKFEWKIKPEYDNMIKSENNCYIVYKDSDCAMINGDGKIIVGFGKISLVNLLTEDLICVYYKSKLHGVVDINGKEILKEAYDEIKMSEDRNYIIFGVKNTEGINTMMYGIAKKDGTILTDSVCPYIIEDQGRFWLAGQFTELNKS